MASENTRQTVSGAGHLAAVAQVRGIGRRSRDRGAASSRQRRRSRLERQTRPENPDCQNARKPGSISAWWRASRPGKAILGRLAGGGTPAAPSTVIRELVGHADIGTTTICTAATWRRLEVAIAGLSTATARYWRLTSKGRHGRPTQLRGCPKNLAASSTSEASSTRCSITEPSAAPTSTSGKRTSRTRTSDRRAMIAAWITRQPPLSPRATSYAGNSSTTVAWRSWRRRSPAGRPRR